MFWNNLSAWNCCKFEKQSIFIKVVTESNIFIFCFISMSDDSFNFKLFIIDVILSSLEKIFKFLALIDTEVINMTFIDESLISKLCERFNIQSISLLKLKLIWLYNEIFDWKSITHTLYTWIIIQEHKNKMMFLLITCLNQHKIIIKNLWLKRNQILINSANDWLIFLLNIKISKSVLLKVSSQSAFHRFERSEICKIKWISIRCYCLKANSICN